MEIYDSIAVMVQSSECHNLTVMALLMGSGANTPATALLAWENGGNEANCLLER